MVLPAIPRCHELSRGVTGERQATGRGGCTQREPPALGRRGRVGRAVGPAMAPAFADGIGRAAGGEGRWEPASQSRHHCEDDGKFGTDFLKGSSSLQ